jgi:hypothetical protein
LGGWAEGFLSEGYTVIGFDIERHDYGTGGYPGQLVLQDVLTLHGSQFRDADCIVASPPCQAYSYRAMPWKRAKALPPPDNTLFEACFRIQREACETAGRYIPLVVENVNGAQRWVGRAAWHYGSFYLWGDVPALMPFTLGGIKAQGAKIDWSKYGEPGYKAIGFNHTNEQRFQAAIKVASTSGRRGVRFTSRDCGIEGVKGMSGLRGMSHPTDKHPRDLGGPNDPRRFHSSSPARKAAAAQIAKIPLPLAEWIARCFKPLPSMEVA